MLNPIGQRLLSLSANNKQYGHEERFRVNKRNTDNLCSTIALSVLFLWFPCIVLLTGHCFVHWLYKLSLLLFAPSSKVTLLISAALVLFLLYIMLVRQVFLNTGEQAEYSV